MAYFFFPCKYTYILGFFFFLQNILSSQFRNPALMIFLSSSDDSNSFESNFCCNIPEDLVVKDWGFSFYIFATLVE